MSEIKPKSYQLPPQAVAMMKEHLRVARETQKRIQALQKEVNEAGSQTGKSIIELMGLDPVGQWQFDTSYIDDLGIAFITGFSLKEMAGAAGADVSRALTGGGAGDADEGDGGPGGLPGGGGSDRGPLN